MSDRLREASWKDWKKEEKDGSLVGPGIDGVELHRPVSHVDHRGVLFEIYNADPVEWPEPVVWIYQTSMYPGVIKGWFVHEHKTDRYCLSSGTILACFYDGREDSPTYGNALHAVLEPRGIQRAVIPPGVWHLVANIGTTEAFLINLPTIGYIHDEPDRRGLPWDTDLIPLDVRSLLPASWHA
jgi:dTDP-4-dehydrorhamnose 3,5-epimerase